MAGAHYDYTDIRYKYAKSPEDVLYGKLKTQGELLKAQFLKRTKKTGLAEIFYKTGHLVNVLPQNMYSKKKDKKTGEIEYNTRMKNLHSQIPAFLKKQLEQEKALAFYKAKTGHTPKLKEKPLLDYRKLSLIQYIIDEEVRQKTLQELFEATEALPKEQVTNEIQMQNEKIKARVRKTLIRIGLDYHIPLPLEPFTEKMQAEDHLRFLKDSVSAQGFTLSLCDHFEQVKQKVFAKKEHAAKSRMLAELSEVEVNQNQKFELFYQAIEEAKRVKTPKAKQACINSLYEQVNNAPAGEIYHVFKEDETFADISADNHGSDEISQRLKTPMPVIHVMTSKHEILHKAETYKSPSQKSTLYECLSLMTDRPEEKENYFRLAMDAAKAMLSPYARTARAISLRNNAPNDMWQLCAQEIVGKGPYRLQLEDVKASSRIQLGYETNKLMVGSIENAKDKTVQNQKNYARESVGFPFGYWSSI